VSAKAFPRRPPIRPTDAARATPQLPRAGRSDPVRTLPKPCLDPGPTWPELLPRIPSDLSPKRVPTGNHTCPRKHSRHPLRASPAGQSLLSNTPMTSVITGTKTIMEEPLAHLLKIRHGRQSTHDLQSLLPVTELGTMSPRSMTQRERRNAIRSGKPRMPETRRR
jgi:hypothetical protein